MRILCHPKWINPIFSCGGLHISCKDGKEMDIGAVLAPVIRTMVGINFA
jgi:hypothetical protein